jgi:dTDP-4-dehydrorhamnose 3,5-epimerase
MRFNETEIAGVVIVEPDVYKDDRGAWILAWKPSEFAERGLETAIAQASTAVTRTRGSIRGMHYQTAPFEEAKVVRVTRGAIFDVAVDLRPDSPTYLRWVGVELSDANRKIMYLPPGCAHGYQTLTDDSEVFYFVSAPYSPPHQRGVRWDDPAFGIAWPLGAPTRINERDATYPYLDRMARQ